MCPPPSEHTRAHSSVEPLELPAFYPAFLHGLPSPQFLCMIQKVTAVLNKSGVFRRKKKSTAHSFHKYLWSAYNDLEIFLLEFTRVKVVKVVRVFPGEKKEGNNDFKSMAHELISTEAGT